MTRKTRIGLVRVNKGLYRNLSGSAVVVRDYSCKQPAWTVRYTDGICCRVEKHFRTLAECRKFLNLA